MSAPHSESGLGRAIQDFRQARRQAAVQSLLGRLTGRKSELLSFEEIDDTLKLGSPYRRYLDDIPLDAIVGSVGRYVDFTRDFLPLSDSDEGRWARVKVAFEQQGLAPIEVYKIGAAYFVLDGNHRVSIARQLGATHIEAYVNEFRSPVSLGPEDDLDAVLLKAEQAEFQAATHLDELRPELALRVTLPGHTRELIEHILVHRYYLGLNWGREFSLPEAVASWADTVYLPVVRLIRELGILRDFPGRTEADLYLWLKRHQAELAAALGWPVEPARAASSLAEQLSQTPRRIWGRVQANLQDLFSPAPLEGGPPPGAWRDLADRPSDRLFASLLVAVNGGEHGWLALEQALPVARHEGAVIKGLHVVRERKALDSSAVAALRAEFDRRCAAAGVAGDLAVEAGPAASLLVRRAVWADLVVVGLKHAPAEWLAGRLRSGFRALLQRSPRPVLAVPAQSHSLARTLLAYDGSPKAEEALFLAAYLATGWGTQLAVLPDTANPRSWARTEARARAYLEERGVQAEYLQVFGAADEAILTAAREQSADLIVLGGYNRTPLMTLLRDSTVDRVLRRSRVPVLVCR